MELSARLLVPGEEELVDSFLKPHTSFAFFMRSNLAKSGLLFEGKANQGDYFGAFEADRLSGVLMHGWMGNVQAFAPDFAAMTVLSQAWKKHLATKPRKIQIFIGPSAHIKNLLCTLGVGLSDLRRGGGHESLFSLSLEKMVLPPLLQNPAVSVRRADKADAELLTSWRHDFFVESVSAIPGKETHALARTEIQRRLDEGDLFILEHQGTPVSFCGVGGFLSDWTNVGLVWTPPDKRNKGYGRTVTAGALSILKREGQTNAVLFSSRMDAQKAYNAIGFTRIGDWLFDFLKLPVERF
jgi:hypothetical protein